MFLITEDITASRLLSFKSEKDKLGKENVWTQGDRIRVIIDNKISSIIRIDLSLYCCAVLSSISLLFVVLVLRRLVGRGKLVR